jgi:hypothetical protein
MSELLLEESSQMPTQLFELAVLLESELWLLEESSRMP